MSRIVTPQRPHDGLGQIEALARGRRIRLPLPCGRGPNAGLTVAAHPSRQGEFLHRLPPSLRRSFREGHNGNADAGFGPGFSSKMEPSRIASMIAVGVSENPCQPVVIVAHDWGVATAMKVARILKEQGICIDELIAIDGVNGPALVGPNVSFENPGNITRVTNIESTTNAPKWADPLKLIPENADAVKDLGGGFVPVTGERSTPATQACVSPARPIKSTDITNDLTQTPKEDHQAVSAGAAAKAAFGAAATRWKAGTSGRPLGNCCGACK